MAKKAEDDDLVISLVELALSCPSTERAVYVERACGDDRELRAQVWNYVEWEQRMDGFLLEALLPRPVFENPFELGDLLQGRFRIKREVAQGGMGIVYEADDEKLNRRVAIKCGKSGFRKRIPPEVRHAREISHPNVCKIFDVHTTSGRQGEIDFLTMEFLEGETLSDLLQRGPLPESEARTIALQLCAGLAEAHRKGVIHGDLKSNNIILTKAADGTTRAVLTDFGLAQASDTAMRTGSSSAAGTPAYMAPELWKGVGPSVASDIYALGVCLYEMLAGQRPPSAKPGAKVQPLTPLNSKWDPIIARCLDPEPSSRFQDAEAVARALSPPSRRLFIVAAVAAVLLAAATGAVTYDRATAPKETVRLAMLAFEGNGGAAISESLLNEATETLKQIKSDAETKLVVMPARSAQGATHALHGKVSNENGTLIVQAYLMDTGSQVKKGEWTAHYKPGQERYLPVALAGLVTSTLRLPPLYSNPVVNEAARQDYSEGLKHLRRNSGTDRALAAFEHAVAADPDSPLTYAALAEAQWFKYFLTGDSLWLERTRDSAQQAQARNPDLPQVHRIAGLLKFNTGLYEQAEAEYRRALELDSNDGDAWRRLAQAYETHSQPDEAIDAYRRAIAADPEMYRNYQGLGAFYLKLTRYREAADYFAKTVQLVPDEPGAHYALGVAHVNSGRYSEAQDELRTAITMHETAAAVNWFGIALMYQSKEAEAIPYFWRAVQLNPERYLSWMDLGICYRRLNRKSEAEQANRRGLEQADAELAKNPRNGYVRGFLAYLSLSLGDRHRAESEIAQAQQLSPNDIDVRWMAVLTYEALGNRAAALELLTASSAEFIADISRWPDLADLHQDSRFIELLASRPVK